MQRQAGQCPCWEVGQGAPNSIGVTSVPVVGVGLGALVSEGGCVLHGRGGGLSCVDTAWLCQLQ